MDPNNDACEICDDACVLECTCGIVICPVCALQPEHKALHTPHTRDADCDVGSDGCCTVCGRCESEMDE